jgi:type I site-specific restriction endonuclease
MQLLIVVDKLLTGFDAPPCTYLYIDKSMQDHALFRAICRTNRLDDEDKDFGYIVDYKDLFKKVENAIAVYTSELDHSAGAAVAVAGGEDDHVATARRSGRRKSRQRRLRPEPKDREVPVWERRPWAADLDLV